MYGKFLTPGKHQYKPIKAMHDSLVEGIREMENNLALSLDGIAVNKSDSYKSNQPPDNTVLVSQESRRWRGMHSFLMKLSEKVNEKEEDITTGAGRTPPGLSKLTKRQLKNLWHKNGMEKYAKEEGVYMTASDIKKVIRFSYEYCIWDDFKRVIFAKKARIFNYFGNCLGYSINCRNVSCRRRLA